MEAKRGRSRRSIRHTKETIHLTGEWLALASAISFAVAGIALRRGSEQLDGNAGLLISVLINALLNSVALGLRIAVGPPFRLNGTGLLFFMGAGLISMFLGRILWIRSIQALGPARAGSFKTAQVVFVLLGAVLLLGERLSWQGLLGAALVLAGLTLLSTEQRSEESGGSRPQNRSGAGYAWGSALSFAFGNLARKAGMTAWRESLAGAAIGAWVAAAAALAMPGSVARLRAALAEAGGRQGALWFIGAGLATSLSQFSLYTALGISPIWKVNLIAATEPLIVALMGLALLRGRERQGWRLWGSALLVTAGVAVIALR